MLRLSIKYIAGRNSIRDKLCLYSIVLSVCGVVESIQLFKYFFFTAKTRHFQGYGLGDTKSVDTTEAMQKNTFYIVLLIK